MKKDKDKSAQAAEQHRLAEHCPREQKTEAIRPGMEHDSRRPLHEARVHQVELKMQNEEFVAARSEVEAGLERYTDLYDFAPVGYFTLDRDGTIRHVNVTGARLVGIERSGLVNRRFGLFVSVETRPAFTAFLEKVFDGRAKDAFEARLAREGNDPLIVRIEAAACVDRQECRVIVTDITEHWRRQAEQELLLSILKLVSTSDNTRDLIRTVTGCLQKWSGCEAVGVRLRDGDDFPYFETRGFPAEFVEVENRLCARDQAGELLRDSRGHPVIECMCGNVLCGRFDPSKPFFTPNGSFWTNSTTELLAGTTEADRQGRTRNRCNGEGYESVALIPVRAGNTTLGMMQFNDRRKGRFTPHLIGMMELLANTFAMALARQQAEDALRQSGEALRERVKELNCLYAIADLIEKEDSLEKILQGSADVMPNGWFYPEIACVRIILEGRQYQTANFRETHWRQYADLKVHGRPAGMIELCYLEERPIRDEGPFLKEERNLIGAIAERLGRVAERKQAEQALREAHDDLELRVKERTADLSRTVDSLMAEVRDRLAAQKSLKESEERFRLIAETVHDVFWISTPGMAKMLYVSPAYEKIWGRSCQSLYEHPESFMEAIFPEDRGRMISGLHRPSEDQWDFEYRIIRPDSTVLWVRDRGYPIRDAQGNLTGMAGTATDITARKLRDANLAESQARLAKAQEIARLGNWEWDIVSNELWWSDQIYRIFGTTPDEFEATYDAFLSFIHPDDRVAVESAVKEALARPGAYSIDHRIITRDGEQRVVHESGEVIRGADGNPIRMSGTVQDITRRKRVEAELQESEQRYRELVELSPIGIIVSVEGEMVFINPAGASILGAPRPVELVGRKVDDLVHADYAMMFRDRLRRVQEMRVELPLAEMQMSKADGTLVVVESASAFVMHKQKPAVQTVFRDVTERNRQAAMIEREHQRLYSVLNMLPGYVSLVGPDHSIRFANHRYLEAFGEPSGRACHLIQCGRDVPCEDCPLPRVLSENRSQEYEWSTPEGRTYRTWAYPFADVDGGSAALTIGLDVTERKALEKQVIDASDIERRSIGRDLHDSLGQELTGLSLLMESLIRGLAEQAPQKAALGRQILKLVRQCVSQVRGMSKGLDPISLRGGGLASGLRDLAEDIHKQSGIECKLRCDDGVSVQDEAVATHLYRIAQEAVNNAVKHAEADHIEIGLAQDDAGIRLTICDDGKGLPGGQGDPDNGMGMRTMRYRASVSGGTLDITAGENGKNGGTKVTCFIPALPDSSRGEKNA